MSARWMLSQGSGMRQRRTLSSITGARASCPRAPLILRPRSASTIVREQRRVLLRCEGSAAQWYALWISSVVSGECRLPP